MAYKTANLNLTAQPFGGVQMRYWTYLNADADSDATLTGTNFFSDGQTKGMQVGDLVDAINQGTAKYKRYQVTALQAASSGAGATVAAPTAIT